MVVNQCTDVIFHQVHCSERLRSIACSVSMTHLASSCSSYRTAATTSTAACAHSLIGSRGDRLQARLCLLSRCPLVSGFIDLAHLQVSKLHCTQIFVVVIGALASDPTNSPLPHRMYVARKKSRMCVLNVAFIRDLCAVPVTPSAALAHPRSPISSALGASFAG